MAISALPQSTIHLLGSTQVLTTTTSLVKELVDNALDAKATSVDILISPNTLDKIEVRDNGHGIPQDDLNALGKRGHTSKLRSFEQLRSIGGVTLGFRGEALASAVQIGEVSVTTKTEGEAVATCVKLKIIGGIASQSRTSHPVGTTVTVSNLISRLPVRKQNALKDAPKTLSRIKDLLQAYALARPHVKFSLKVTKGGKGSWSFTPRPNDGIKEAVSQLFGRDTASQCLMHSVSLPSKSSNPQTEGETHLSQDQFGIEVVLPRPDADVYKISGPGQYISVDSRPVAHNKGTIKKIVTCFKTHFNISNSPNNIKAPFLRLNIKCPVASYDPNVEPSKDDVLFANESLLLDAIETYFKGIYDENIVQQAPVESERIANSEKIDTGLLLSEIVALSPVSNLHYSVNERTFGLDVSQMPVEKDLESSKFRVAQHDPLEPKRPDMANNEGVQQTPSGLFESSHHSQDEQSNIDSTVANSLNPWSIAKLTAPVHSANNLLSRDLLFIEDERDNPPQGQDFVSARNVMDGFPTPPRFDAPSISKKARINKPFVTPRRHDENPASLDTYHQTILLPTPPTTQNHKEKGPPNTDLNLDWAMDFENRKETATRRRRQELRVARLGEQQCVFSRTSPHKHRYNAAVLNLETDQEPGSFGSPEKAPFKSLLPDGRSRTYHIRHQKPDQKMAEGLEFGQKAARTKASKLPLEKIPNTDRLHMLVFKIEADCSHIQRAGSELARTDSYILRGSIETLAKVEERTLLLSKLQVLVDEWIETDAGKDFDGDLNLENLTGFL